MFKAHKKNFVSELDSFLQDFDKRMEATSSNRRTEEARSARVARLRDQVSNEGKSSEIWEDF